MKKSIKITALLLTLISTLSMAFSGCEKQFSLLSSVSQLREQIFLGEKDSLKLKAHYGFSEYPFVNDGKVGEVEYSLDFILSDKQTDNATYSVCLSFDGKDYEAQFKLDPVKHLLTASIPVDNFTIKEFTVNIKSGSDSVEILLKSALPENILSPKTALDTLLKSQTALVNSYKDELGNFNAEIYMRVLVKEDKPYYYVGFASGEDKLKALLIDGVSGEVLAIREVF